jgi:hypothetical protein
MEDQMSEEAISQPQAPHLDDDYLVSAEEAATRLGYTYGTWMQARTEGRVLLPETRTSDSPGARVKYRLGDIRRVIRGEIKAMKAAPFPEEQKERVRKRSAERKAEKAGRQ